jgi:hypothetical protein
MIDQLAESYFMSRGMEELIGYGASQQQLDAIDKQVKPLASSDVDMSSIETKIWESNLDGWLSLQRTKYEQELAQKATLALAEISQAKSQNRLPDSSVLGALFPLTDTKNVDWSFSGQWVS